MLRLLACVASRLVKAMTRFCASIALAMLSLGDAKTALLLIDVQECFLENGTLPVTASFIVPKINSIRATKSCLFDKVFKSQDFHLPGHVSFGTSHGKTPITGAWQGVLDITCMKPTSGTTADASCCPTVHINKTAVDCTATHCPADDYYTKAPGNGIITGNTACTTCKDTPASCFKDTQTLWADHCLQAGDSGFAKALTSMDTDVVVQKGTNKYVDAYSAFMDNSGNLKTSLDASLQAAGITTLYVAGIATDVCVKWTVRDALASSTGNYTVKVISDASAGIWGLAGGTNDKAEADAWFATQGASVVTTAQVLAMACPAGATTGTTGDVTTGTTTSSASLVLLVLSMVSCAFWHM